jgi:hypothetical protein
MQKTDQFYDPFVIDELTQKQQLDLGSYFLENNEEFEKINIDNFYSDL